MGWREFTVAGNQAHERGRHEAAENFLTDALKEAESFAPGDPRLVDSLNNLAELYYTMGKYAQAEPLYLNYAQIRRSRRRWSCGGSGSRVNTVI